MGDFQDHPIKIVIREQWCKPILRYIHQTLGYKMVYLGLPGINALDIKSWIEFIDKVIAFEIGDYTKKDPKIAESNIGKLNEILENYERKGFLKTFSLYNGYIEKVVLKGKDENGDVFNQQDVVTIYNLDFCNSLTAPITITDDKGHISKHYKTEVLCKLLEIQRDLDVDGRKKKFIMFVTVHSKFWEEEVDVIKIDNDPLFKLYIDSLKKMEKEEKNVRLLKAYFCKICKEHFSSRKIIPDFLPPIYYKGIGKNNKLLCFTIVGTFHGNPASTACSSQDISSFLKSTFLTADDKRIFNYKTVNITESENATDSIELLKRVDTFKKIWETRH